MLLVCLALAPCARAALPSAPPPAAIEVALQVDAVVGPGQRRALLPGEKLRSGDSFTLTVTANRRAHVYVAHVSGKGETALLYPASGGRDVMVSPGEPVVLPGGDKSFHLDDQIGTESLLVLAADHPLVGAEKDSYLQRAEQQPLPPAPPPPPPIDSPARPGELKAESRPKVVRSQARHGGVALLRFPIRHERRRP